MRLSQQHPRNGPSGNQGRGTRNTLRAGNCVWPDMWGQMPASARNNVDLPLPDGAVMSTVSPGTIARFTSASTVWPPGKRTVR